MENKYNSYSPRTGYENRRPPVEPEQSKRVAAALSRLAMKSENKADFWQNQTLCSEVDPGLFDEENKVVDQAKEVCTACDVQAQCLAFALKNNENFLIWGGMTAEERKILKRKLVRNRHTQTS